MSDQNQASDYLKDLINTGDLESIKRIKEIEYIMSKPCGEISYYQFACTRGQVNIVKYFTEINPYIHEMVDKCGNSVIILSAMQNNKNAIEIIDYLADMYKDEDMLTKRNTLDLNFVHLCCINNWNNVLQHLLNKYSNKFDFNEPATNFDNILPIEITIKLDNYESFEVLVNNHILISEEKIDQLQTNIDERYKKLLNSKLQQSSSPPQTITDIDEDRSDKETTKSHLSISSQIIFENPSSSQIITDIDEACSETLQTNIDEQNETLQINADKQSETLQTNTNKQSETLQNDEDESKKNLQESFEKGANIKDSDNKTFDENENSSIQKQLSEKDAFISKLIEEITSYKIKFSDEKIAEFNKTQEQNEYLKKELEDLQIKNSKLDEKISELKSRNNELKSESEDFKDQNDKLKAEINQIQEKNVRLEPESKQIIENNTRLKKELDEIIENYNQLKIESEEIQKRNSILENEMKPIKDRNDKLENELKEIKKEMTQIKENNAKLMTELGTITKENNQLNNKSERNKESNAELKNKLTQIKGMNANLENELTWIKGINANLQSELARIKEANAKLENQMKLINNELKQSKDRETELANELVQIKEANAQSENESTQIKEPNKPNFASPRKVPNNESIESLCYKITYLQNLNFYLTEENRNLKQKLQKEDLAPIKEKHGSQNKDALIIKPFCDPNQVTRQTFANSKK